MASLFGMEAALYCASGTMSNQAAIASHTRPGDEVICEQEAHVYIYEGGGIAYNSGCQVRPVPGDRGRIRAGQILQCINADDVHKARTSLVCLENTSNRGGGSCYDLNEIIKIKDLCDKHELILHLDGARLFNALVAKNEKPEVYGSLFHSISVCFNKGLGCPAGSVLMGSRCIYPAGPAGAQSIWWRNASGRISCSHCNICPRSSYRQTGNRSPARKKNRSSTEKTSDGQNGFASRNQPGYF